MNHSTMTSFGRVLSAIQLQEPDRVPLFLLLSLYGAKELKLPVKDYFSKPQNVIDAQLAMREKYRNDCLYSFFYAPIEIEAWGGEVVFVDDGPPNSGEPFIKNLGFIDSMGIPHAEDTPCLRRVLEATAGMKQQVKDTVPIIGVVVSPFSLPVMQMGFEKYLDLIYFNKPYFEKLMQKNIEFTVAWANAQIDAGASAICYFDPLASPNMIDRNLYLSTGHKVAQKTLSRIKGPTAVHLASAISLPVLDDIAGLGAAVLGFSYQDDLVAIKKAATDKICLLGNLNGVDMVRWNQAQVEANVKKIIQTAGRGGGLILSDTHGEIPWQVPEEVLLGIAEAVDRWGKYPLDWVTDHAEA